MASADSTITVRIDMADLTDTLGVLAQAFQDCADALLMARDKLDEATAVAEREDEDTHPPTVSACTCGRADGLHDSGCAVTGGATF